MYLISCWSLAIGIWLLAKNYKEYQLLLKIHRTARWPGKRREALEQAVGYWHLAISNILTPTPLFYKKRGVSLVVRKAAVGY